MMKVGSVAAVLFLNKVQAINIKPINDGTSHNQDPDDGIQLTAIPKPGTETGNDNNMLNFCRVIFQYEKLRMRKWQPYCYKNDVGEDVTRAVADGTMKLSDTDHKDWLYSTNFAKLESGSEYRDDGKKRTRQRFTDVYRRRTLYLRMGAAFVDWQYESWNSAEEKFTPIHSNQPVMALLQKNSVSLYEVYDAFKKAKNNPLNHVKWSYSTKLENLTSTETYSKSITTASSVVGKRVSEWRRDGSPRNKLRNDPESWALDKFRMRAVVYAGVLVQADDWAASDEVRIAFDIKVDVFASLEKNLDAVRKFVQKNLDAIDATDIRVVEKDFGWKKVFCTIKKSKMGFHVYNQ